MLQVFKLLNVLKYLISLFRPIYTILFTLALDLPLWPKMTYRGEEVYKSLFSISQDLLELILQDSFGFSCPSSDKVFSTFTILECAHSS